MKKWLFLILICFSIGSIAQIYMKTDKNGNVIYSDMPMEDAQTLIVPTDGSGASHPVESKPIEESPLPPVKKPYTTFRIISPKNDESIQNQASLKVEINLEPALQQGDKIQIYLDGKKIGPLVDSLTIDVGLIDRGTHELYAEIVDAQQRNIMQSNVITIYYHRARIGFPANKNNQG